MSNGAFQNFSIDDGDSHIGGRNKPFKAEANRTYRLSFCWWEGLADSKPDLDGKAPQFTGAQTHFIPNVGYVVNKGPEFTKLAGEPPRQRIATIVIIWPTDRNGVVDRSQLGSGGAQVQAWVFSGDKYRSLQQIHREFPFGSHDITLNCSDATFQKMTFSPCKENLLRSLMGNPKAKDIVDKFIGEATQILAKINDYVGREMTIQQVRDKLSGAGGAGPELGPSTMPQGNVDSMVDDLLDA